MKSLRFSQTLFTFAALLSLSFCMAQPQGVWEKVNVKDEYPNETEIKKKLKSYSFMAKTGENFLTYDMGYYAEALKKSFKYIGTLSWDWNSQKGYLLLIPGEVVNVKVLVSNNSPNGSVSGWIQYGNWAFTKPVPPKPDIAGPNSTIKLEGSFTVAKQPGLHKDGSIQPYLWISFHLMGGNETRFIKRTITYKWKPGNTVIPPNNDNNNVNNAITGTYNTDFNQMKLSISGNKVTGTYQWNDGKIEGTLNGTVLTGWWYQSNGKGRFIFNFNSNFTAFTGKWGRGDSEPTSTWNGTKTSN